MKSAILQTSCQKSKNNQKRRKEIQTMLTKVEITHGVYSKRTKEGVITYTKGDTVFLDEHELKCNKGSVRVLEDSYKHRSATFKRPVPEVEHVEPLTAPNTPLLRGTVEHNEWLEKEKAKLKELGKLKEAAKESEQEPKPEVKKTKAAPRKPEPKKRLPYKTKDGVLSKTLVEVTGKNDEERTFVNKDETKVWTLQKGVLVPMEE